jgi:hypothetical protein
MKGKTEFDKFSDLTKSLLSVPKAEIDKRHEEWKKQKDRKHKKTAKEGKGKS